MKYSKLQYSLKQYVAVWKTDELARICTAESQAVRF